MIQEQSSTQNMGIIWSKHDQDLDEPGRLIQIKAFDLDHALAGTGLDLEVSRTQAFLMIWRVPDKLGP